MSRIRAPNLNIGGLCFNYIELSLRLYQPIKHNKQMTRMGIRDSTLWQQVLSDHMRS